MNQATYTKLVQIAAELAQGKPLRPLQTVMETSSFVIGTATVNQALEQSEDLLKLLALDIRQTLDHLPNPIKDPT